MLKLRKGGDLMKLNGIYAESADKGDFFQKEPFKKFFSGVLDGKKYTIGYFEFNSKDIEKYTNFLDPNGFILSNHLIYKYESKKLKLCSFTFRNAEMNYRQRRNCIKKIEHYKNKHSELKNDIVINRKIKFLGFKRLRYCNNGNDFTLPFAIYSPKNIKGKIPLLIYLHGYTNGGESNLIPFYEALPIIFRTKLNIKKNPAFILIPSLPKYEGFPSEKDKGFDKVFTQLFEKLLSEYPIDEKRVYIMGSSNGGMGSWSQIGHHPERYAAAIPMMGCISNVNVEEYCRKIKDKPVWAVHAENDKAVDIGNSKRFGSQGSDIITAQLKEIGSNNLKYTRYKKYGHSAAGHFIKTENWHSWLFKNKQ